MPEGEETQGTEFLNPGKKKSTQVEIFIPEERKNTGQARIPYPERVTGSRDGRTQECQESTGSVRRPASRQS
jgi:hypothetical protein